MNHIYKTIFNKRTGQVDVVSEKTSNNCQSQQEKTIQPQEYQIISFTKTVPQFSKKRLALAMGILLSSLVGQISYAATTQDYTGTEALINSSDLSNGFKDLINNPDGDKKGVVVVDTNNDPVLSDTALTINYSDNITPDFVVAGYASFDKNNPQDDDPETQIIEVSNNEITLNQGNINGSFYAGLVQHTEKTANIECTTDIELCDKNTVPLTKTDRFQNIQITNNLNTITIKNNSSIQIKEDLVSGQNSIISEYGDFNSVVARSNTKYNQLETNNNRIFIDGITKVQHVNAGQNLINTRYNNFNADTNTQTDASLYSQLNNNKFFANQNEITINGNTITQNITAGQNLINSQHNNFNAANTDADSYAYTVVIASTTTNTSEFTANQNEITINGDTITQNITAGRNLINSQHNNFNAANANTNPNAYASAYATANTYNYASASTLIANENLITINGNTITQNITAGQNLISSLYGNVNAADTYANANAYSTATITGYTTSNNFVANNNQIIIDGIINTKNINAGQSLINFQYGNVNAANAYTNDNPYSDAKANIDANNSTLIANENLITINGNTTTQNITAGHVGINLQYGDIKAGKQTQIINGVENLSSGRTYLNIDLHKTSLETNGNQIDIKGQSIISGNIKTGHIDFHLGFGKLIELGINTDLTSNDYGKTTEKEAENPLIYTKDVNVPRRTNNYISLNGSKAFAKNNTISIEGTHTVDNPESVIYGGYLNYNKDKEYFLADADGNPTEVKAFVRPESYDVFSGNTLNYNNNVPIKIKEIGNFQAYNFVLNPNLANSNTALITANKVYLGSTDDNMSTDQVQKQIYKTVSTAVQASESLDSAIKAALPSIADDEVNPNYAISANIKDEILKAEDINQSVKNALETGKVASDIKVVGIQSGNVLATDTKFILLQADKGNLIGLGQGYLSRNVAQQGISLLYDVETSVDQTNDQVIATITAGGPNNPNNPIPEEPKDLEPVPPIGPKVNPQLKALLEGNLSGLMLLGRGADHLSDNLFGQFDQQTQRGLVPFTIFSGQHSRYDSGSSIKSNSGLFTAGVSIYDDQSVWGAFIENGWDSYKTHNSFDNANDVNGKGHNRFNGFGVFARYTFDNQAYLDGTLRGGRLHTTFGTDDLRHAVSGERASYDLKGNYYGASLKGGYDWAWNTQNTLDLSAKYTLTGTKSQNLTVAQDQLHFDKLNSHRVLFNAENNYQMNPEVTLISGLGYEYEFDGKANGTTYEVFKIDEVSMKGSTGVATLGLRYQPEVNKRLNVDLKGSGYFGKREGGSALLKVDYKF